MNNLLQVINDCRNDVRDDVKQTFFPKIFYSYFHNISNLTTNPFTQNNNNTTVSNNNNNETLFHTILFIKRCEKNINQKSEYKMNQTFSRHFYFGW